VGGARRLRECQTYSQGASAGDSLGGASHVGCGHTHYVQRNPSAEAWIHECAGSSYRGIKSTSTLTMPAWAQQLVMTCGALSQLQRMTTLCRTLAHSDTRGDTRTQVKH